MLLLSPESEKAPTPFHEPQGTLRIDPAGDIETQRAAVAAAPAVLIEFPSFRDGRGFSTARLLRGRFGYAGPIYGKGPLIPDQAPFLWRVGFSGFILEDEARIEDWRAASARWTHFAQPHPRDAQPGSAPVQST